MMALSPIPFYPYDGRQAGLLYLPARWRDTTAQEMPAKGITLPQDETFTGGLGLSGDGPREQLHSLRANGPSPRPRDLACAHRAGACRSQLSSCNPPAM